MAKLVLSSLSRRFQGAERAALEGLSLEVESGELLVLVGPSGCGKSTALRLIAGLDTPDSGGISLDGKELVGVAPQDRDVAMVFQGYALYPHLTARENLAFPLKMRGVSKSERDTKVREAAELLGIDKLLDRHPGELSGGERQRVAMGRAIVRRPKVFLFDEPLSNLDAALRGDLRTEIAALVRRLGTTSIYVTHDQTEAMTMGDRIAVLSKGTLQQVGTPRAIYEAPDTAFVAGFLGAPPINLVRLSEKRGAGASWPAPADDAIAGVRPEHVSLGDGEPREGAIAFEAKVVSREPLGAETHLVLEASGTTLRAKTAGFEGPMRDDTVKLSVDPKKVLWFDAKTERRILP